MSFPTNLDDQPILGGFAPASWTDAEETTPTGVIFDIGGNGVSSPYSSAVNAIMHKHMEEIKGKTNANLNLPSAWKRKLRDFMVKKNNELLDFLKVSVPHHPVLGPGETLLRRFGNPQVSPNHPSVRDMVLDISGETGIDEVNAALRCMSGGEPLKDYAEHTSVIYDLYKEAGDEVLRAQEGLKAKLYKLDRIQGKIASLFEIDPNDKYEPLMQANEDYLKKIFEENGISEDYENVIKAYRKFITLRDVVAMSRSLLAQESEPLCSICLEESVTFALSPCGHTFCQTCIRRQNGQCFICRTNIKEKLKLYFG